MKNVSILMIFFVLIVTNVVFAQGEKGPDLTGAITYKFDHVEPDSVPNRAEHRVEVYTRYRGLLGVGIDTVITPKSSYGFFRPYATVTKGTVSLIAGYSTDSKNVEYAFGGIWLAPSAEKLKLFLDVRNFTALSRGASSYQDNFIEIAYPINEKMTVGVNGVYDHYWDKELDFVLVGPVAYYAVTDQIKLFTRYSREWCVYPKSSDSADRFRFGVKFSF